MGKTDLRDPARIAAAHGGAQYRAFDLLEVDPDRIGQMLRAIGALLESGALRPLPLASYDMREVAAAFRSMAQAHHVGKVVLTTPRTLDPAATALLTGGTGSLGRALAEHLVRVHGLRHLVLTSRSGGSGPDTESLIQTLRSAGAESVRIERCDVADRTALTAILSSLAPEQRWTAIFHLAGVLDDGILEAQNAERLRRVLQPKVDGALLLDELSEALDLDAFVLFSSIAGTIGNAGQSNYAAANSFLDALALHRAKRGLPALSLAWGAWEQQGSGMTAQLGSAELARLRRQGIAPLSQAEGWALLDTALLRSEPALVPLRVDLAHMQAQADRGTDEHALFRALLRSTLRKAASVEQDRGGLRDRLGGMSPEERRQALLELVQTEVAMVLGLPGPKAITPDQLLSELGLDSLAAVEIRNRVAPLIDAPLSSTLLFDYPTAKQVADFLASQLTPAPGAAEPAAPALPVELDLNALAKLLRTLTRAELEKYGLVDGLSSLQQERLAETSAAEPSIDIESQSTESVLSFLEKRYGDLGSGG
jgi:NAD(P)-dependent dehydrogenase (short-subunit alcohol dehydrogenase family)/acyl carrier protein